MTTLAGIQGDGWCVLAADSQTTSGNVKADISAVGKIAQNGKFLVSGAGLVRGLNILSFGFTPPKKRKQWNLDSYMTNQFIPALREEFIDNGYDIKPENSFAWFDNELLVATEGVIYSIDEAYGWERCTTKIHGAGSGGQIVLGILDALGGQNCNDVEQAVSIIDRAIRITRKWDTYTGGYVQIAVQFADGKTTVELIDEE